MISECYAESSSYTEKDKTKLAIQIEEYSNKPFYYFILKYSFKHKTTNSDEELTQTVCMYMVMLVS